MTIAGILSKKRDGGELAPEELAWFLDGFQQGAVTDYQMAAFLMAVCIQGMTPQETAILTTKMVASGRVLNFDHLEGAKADKHSTGGVGDWISLALAPLVAVQGVWVPMMAGRGLGHTGGTLDKLESIPGYRVQLDPEEFRAAVQSVGAVIAGQTEDLAPLDRKMYALRDVTGTVESVPLIVSSILSKKKAEGIDVLVMDVKCGRGAFMRTQAKALELASELCRVGALLEIRVVAFITNMDRPLGNALGNALEVKAAVECLEGRGPEDSLEVLCTLATGILCLTGKAESWDQGWELVEMSIKNGDGFNRFKKIVAVQGGDVSVIENLERLPQASVLTPVVAGTGGLLEDVDPLALAYCVLDLGAGRKTAGDAIRHEVGVCLLKRHGDAVQKGESLAVVHSHQGAPQIVKRVSGAMHIGPHRPESEPMVYTLVTSKGSWPWKGASTWEEAF